jgi:Ran GTPase-activating protein (RanGAP) involved in mRNA processing and transport
LGEHAMTHLDLSHNKLGDKFGICIGKWLADNVNLLKLDLSWNHIRKKGAIGLFKGLQENIRLNYLNVSWNGISNECGDGLFKLLSKNSCLEELDIRHNRIETTGFIKFAAAFKENLTLKKLLVGNNNITDKAIEYLFDILKTIDGFKLELLDISNITFRKNIEPLIESVKELNPDFKCLHGFLNFSDRSNYNPSEAAMLYIQQYCEQNNVSLMDLFAKLDTVSVSTLITFNFNLKLILFFKRTVQCQCRMMNSRKVYAKVEYQYHQLK